MTSYKVICPLCGEKVKPEMHIHATPHLDSWVCDKCTRVFWVSVEKPGKLLSLDELPGNPVGFKTLDSPHTLAGLLRAAIADVLERKADDKHGQ